MITSLDRLNRLETLVNSKKGSATFAWYADLLLADGRIEEALSVLDEGLVRWPSHVPGLVIKSKALVRLARNVEAESVLTQVLALDSMHLASLKMAYEVFSKMGRKERASEVARSLNELDVLGDQLPVIEMEQNGQNAIIEPGSDFFIEKDALFASLDDVFLEDGNDDRGDEITADDLQRELERALKISLGQITDEPEYFPTDEEAIAGGAVGSRIDQFFGETTYEGVRPDANVNEVMANAFDALFSDDVPTTANSSQATSTLAPDAPASPFASFASAPAPKAPEIESSTSDPDSDDLFQKNSSSALFAPKTESSSPFEKNAELEISAKSDSSDDGVKHIAHALDDLFGDDDDLPEELFKTGGTSQPAQIPDDEPMSMFGQVESPLVVPPAPKEPDELTTGIASALDGMFGTDDDELPIELGSSSSTSTIELDTPPELPLESDLNITESSPLNDLTFDEELETSQDVLPLVEESDEESLDLAVEDSSMLVQAPVEEDAIAETDVIAEHETAPASEEVAESEPVAEVEAPQDELSLGVSSALDGLLGSDDDDLPIEMLPSLESNQDFVEEAIQESPSIELPLAIVPEISETPLNELTTEISSALDGLLGGEEPLAEPLIPKTPAPKATPVVPQLPVDEDSMSGGMNHALSDLFGSELDEDLSELMDSQSPPPTSNGATKTLAEIYFSQGLLNESLQMYQDLLDREPTDQEAVIRVQEIKRIIEEKEHP